MRNNREESEVVANTSLSSWFELSKEQFLANLHYTTETTAYS